MQALWIVLFEPELWKTIIKQGWSGESVFEHDGKIIPSNLQRTFIGDRSEFYCIMPVNTRVIVIL